MSWDVGYVMGRALKLQTSKSSYGRNVHKYMAHMKKRNKAKHELEAMDVDV
jgi:hypothetical protein